MAEQGYQLSLAEEKAVARVQAMAIRLMTEKQISRKELAVRMGVSQAHISQLLSDEPQNLTVKKAARIFHFLGERLRFECDGIDALNARAAERRAQKARAVAEAALADGWRSFINSNEYERPVTKVAQAA